MAPPYSGYLHQKRSENLKSPINFKLVMLYCFSLIASYYKCGVTGLQQLSAICVMTHCSLLRVVFCFLLMRLFSPCHFVFQSHSKQINCFNWSNGFRNQQILYYAQIICAVNIMSFSSRKQLPFLFFL